MQRGAKFDPSLPQPYNCAMSVARVLGVIVTVCRRLLVPLGSSLAIILCWPVMCEFGQWAWRTLTDGSASLLLTEPLFWMVAFIAYKLQTRGR